MKKILLFALAILAGPALALDYQTALSLAAQRPTVISARLKLDDAEAQLRRTIADPLALRLDRLKAQQNRDLAAAELRQARIHACAEISTAYSRLLDAEAQLKLAERGLALAERGLEITRLRLKKGGASEQELTVAEINLQEAKDRLQSASNGVELARSQLVSLLGVEAGTDSLEPTPTMATPAWDDLLRALETHPDWLKPHQAAELAATAHDLLDPSYAAPAQIENARVNMERAAKGAAEAERGLKIRAEMRWNEVTTKEQALELAGEKLQKARDDLAIARKRFDAGLISEFALQQVEMQEAQAALAHLVAEHDLLASQWALFEATGWLPPEVCDER